MAGLNEYTLVADPAVLRRWHQRPAWHLIAVVLPAHGAVERRRLEIAHALDDLVEPGPPGQPHITVWVSGQTPVPGFAGRSVTVTVGGSDTFTSAAYLSVEGDALAAIRDELAAVGPAEDRLSPYVPHITIGTYRKRVPLAQARAALAPWTDLSPLTMTADVHPLVLDPRTGRLSRLR